MSWIAVAGTAISVGGSLLSSSGSKQSGAPAVPYQNIDPGAVESQTIATDQANAGAAQTLAGGTNTFNQGQATALMNAALPGYSGLASNLTKQATSLAENPYAVPQSVVDQLSQYAAENNIGEGTGAASGFSQSNLLRSLGVNALQYGQTNMQTALGALSTLTGTAPKVSPTSPLSFLLQPGQVLQTDTNNNTNNQQIAQGAANSATAASNANSSNLWDNLTSAVGGTQGLGNTLGPILAKLLGGGNPPPIATSPGAGAGAGADINV